MTTDAVSGTIGASHFHHAVTGSNGPVVLDFSGALLNNEVSFSGPVSGEIVSDLLKGEIYINAHTPAFPGGELRGQMFRLARDGYGFDMCTGQESSPVNAPDAQGSGLISIDRLHTNANIAIVTDGLTGPVIGAHLHEAPIGENGGVIYDLTPYFNNGAVTGFGIPVDTSIINAIQAANVYANVHTDQHPDGELRGQVVKEFLCSIETGVNPIEGIVSEVKLSPVPVGEFVNVTIKSDQIKDVTIKVFDLSGKIISIEPVHLSAGSNMVRLETDSLYPGFYLLTISDGKGTGTYKFVK
jgi:hypothetical protein